MFCIGAVMEVVGVFLPLDWLSFVAQCLWFVDALMFLADSHQARPALLRSWVVLKGLPKLE